MRHRPSPVHMGSPDDVPLEGRLVFFLKSMVPQDFPRNQKVEVAAADGSFHTVLSLADGSLMLEDARPRWAAVEPLARFGSSAFGPVAGARGFGRRSDRRLDAAGNPGAPARLQGAALPALRWPSRAR